VAHEREETRDDVGFVAGAYQLEIHDFGVEQQAEERDDGVDGYHEENAYDTGSVSCCIIG